MSDVSWVHRHAGLVIQFEWQDECAESGNCAGLDSTAIVGKFEGTENYLVCCDGTATDGAAQGEYWWPVKAYLVVWKQENGEPISRHATDEEVEMFGEEP